MLFWFFLQSTEETAEENSLRILKRKNSRHKGVARFREHPDDTVIRYAEVQSLGVAGSSGAANISVLFAWDGWLCVLCKAAQVCSDEGLLITVQQTNLCALAETCWLMWAGEFAWGFYNSPALVGRCVQRRLCGKRGGLCLAFSSISAQANPGRHRFFFTSLSLRWAPLEGEGCSSARWHSGMGWQRPCCEEGTLGPAARAG